MDKMCRDAVKHHPLEVCACDDKKKTFCRRKMMSSKKELTLRTLQDSCRVSLRHFTLAQSRGSFSSLRLLRGEPRNQTQSIRSSVWQIKSKLPTWSKLWILKWNSKSKQSLWEKKRKKREKCLSDIVQVHQLKQILIKKKSCVVRCFLN